MRILALIVLVFGLTAAPQPRFAAAQDEAAQVDLELVLAVDISYSMDSDELQLQRDGYISAVKSKQVLDAIKEGVYGRIAITYVEWAGFGQQQVIIDWHVIDGPASAQDFADRLAETAPNRAYRTSISGALQFSARHFAKNPYKGVRKVIDISGDGPNNQGDSVTYARDRVVEQGIGINGLPLILKGPNGWSLNLDNLEQYYRDCVIGGPGAFVIPVSDTQQFAEAIRTKLVLEISGLEPPPRLMRAQSNPANCMVGEQIWRDRYGESGPEWQ